MNEKDADGNAPIHVAVQKRNTDDFISFYTFHFLIKPKCKLKCFVLRYLWHCEVFNRKKGKCECDRQDRQLPIGAFVSLRFAFAFCLIQSQLG